MKERKSKLGMGRKKKRGKGEGVVGFRAMPRGRVAPHDNLANP
jgi:hypothetical protein